MGADRINDTVIGMLDRISKDNKIELLFGTGDRNYDKIMSKIKESGITLSDNIKIVSYIDNMAECMAAADVVVSRAGAITVSEMLHSVNRQYLFRHRMLCVITKSRMQENLKIRMRQN